VSLLQKYLGLPELTPGLEPFPGYRLQHVLGMGGFAEVWHASVEGGTAAALKFMRCNGKAAFQEMKSLQIVGQLAHPNLVAIRQVWTYRHYLVIAMELGEGSFDQLLEVSLQEFGRGLSSRNVCSFLAPIADAIDFLNNRQHRIQGVLSAIRHGDVKPSNMLFVDNVPKLSDFGLASVAWSAQQQMARQGSGTTHFAAPEIFAGQVSDRSDQYALAISYCQLRGGRLPFPDTPATFREDYHRPRPDLSMVHETERPILARALDPTPLLRWRTCKEMIAHLTAALRR
jgi:serine/threonine protein kinase